MRTRFPIYGRGRELSRVRTEFGITEAAKTGIKAPSFNVTHKTLPDGTRVKLTTIAQFATPSAVPPAGSPMQPSMRIARVTKQDEGGRTHKCECLHGFLNLINWNSISEDGYISQVAFRAAGGFVDTPLLTGSFSGSSYPPAPCALAPVERWSPSSMLTKLGSAFSGTMRKVVQLMGGMNMPIPYDYCYSKSDGIFVASDGSHWVVRVDNATGIWTQKIPTCETLTTERKTELGIDFDYIPSPILGPWKKIASASVLSEYSATLPFYTECGWAFSYDGSEAQNVTWTLPDADPWKRAYRFKISIVGGTNGPTSASVEIVEESYLWGDIWAAPKFPHFLPAATGGGQSLLTFDTRSIPVLAGAPPGDYSNIPFYVFYVDGESEPVVIRTGSTGAGDDEDVDTFPPANYQSCPGGGDWGWETSPGAATGLFGTYTKVFSSKRTYEFDGPIDLPEDVDLGEPSWSGTGTLYKISSERVGGWHKSGKPRWAWAERWVCTNSFGAGTVEYASYQGLLIPFYDREQAYLFVQARNNWTMPNPGVRKHGLSYGDWKGSIYVSGEDDDCAPLGELWYYQAVTCAGPTPSQYGTDTTFQNYNGTVWLADPIDCTPWWLDACSPAATTIFFESLGGPVPSSCPAISDFPGEDGGDSYKRMALYAIDHRSSSFVQVKEWEDEYDPYNPYVSTILSASSGSIILVSHPDAFSGAGFASMESGGTQGDKYYYFGTADTSYPLSDLTSGFDRGWFGAPFF